MKKIEAVSTTYPIPELIPKYLEYLDFVKNLSAHSLRAYASDLLQVFQIKNYCDKTRGVTWLGVIQ